MRTLALRPRAHPAHMWAGTAMTLVGTSALAWGWEAFGVVARGMLPFIALAAGLVMTAGGVRSLRRREARGGGALVPILVVLACAGLAAAAGSEAELELSEEWSAGRVVGYLALGLISGITGGMLGLGGGLVHLSGLTLWFGFPFGVARGATLINNIFICGAAALRYGRRGLLLPAVVTLLLPASLIGVIGGTLVQAELDELLLRRIFSAVVVVIIVGMVIDTMAASRSAPRAEPLPVAPVRHGLTGAAAGLLCGILGISGGVVAVPGQTLLARVPLRHAIASGTLITAAASALGSLLLFLPLGGRAPSVAEMATIAALFVPGNVIGGHYGAIWMERLPVLVVRLLFILALVAIAVRALATVE